jgi:RHS repeat-associated protein
MLNSAASSMASQFTGKERDAETGLDYFGARYMSAPQGRFMSPDPLYVDLRRLSDPQQINLYSYVRNNPLKFIDPTGLYLYCNGSQENCEGYTNRLQASLSFPISFSAGRITTSFEASPMWLMFNPVEADIYNIIMSPSMHVYITMVDTPRDSNNLFGSSELANTGKNPGKHAINILQAAMLTDGYTFDQLVAHETLEAVYEILGLRYGDAHDLSIKNPGFEGMYTMKGGELFGDGRMTPMGEMKDSAFGFLGISGGSNIKLKVYFEFVTPVPYESIRMQIVKPDVYPVGIERVP